MMLQYFYTSKSQQMATAATIAALEQQNLVQLHGQRSETMSLSQLPVASQQQQEPVSLLSKCLNSSSSTSSSFQHKFQQPQAQQFQATGLLANQAQCAASGPLVQGGPTCRSSPLNYHLANKSKAQHQQNDAQDFVIDARCKTECSSSNESFTGHSPISQENRSQLNYGHDAHLDIGLNFELGKLDAHNSENFLISNNLNHDVDLIEDNSEDSDDAVGDDRACTSGAQAQPIEIKGSSS